MISNDHDASIGSRPREAISPLKAGIVECSGRQNLECEELAAPLKLVFVYHGRLGLDRGPEWVELSAGDLLLMRQNERSRAAIAYPPDLVYFWLLFETRPGSDIDLKIPPKARAARPRRLADLFQLLLEDQESDGLDSPAALGLIDSLFSEIRNRLSPGEASPSLDERHVERAFGVIHARFRDPISTRDIAEELSLSPDHLGRIFRKVTGRSVIQEIQQTRLREARLQLLENRETIEAVAAACGFADVGYFRRVFRKIEGMSPAQFREQFR